ncbi:hypothetical protein BX600DRAFT_555619 [Xylariales sp. PMI_506]|nr:hypothetical protein BX600DRAFT_555619 [Xylariales sp. PMI_506]
MTSLQSHAASWPAIVLLALLGASSVSALATKSPESCAEGVIGAYNYITFAGNYTGPDYCQNQLKVDSINAAFRVHCSPQHLQASIDVIDKICEGQVLPVSEWVSDPSEVAKLRVVDYGEFRRKIDRLTEPVMISETFYDRAFRTIHGWRNTVEAHQVFSVFQSVFWFVVFAAAASTRWLGLAIRRIRGREHGFRPLFGHHKSQWFNNFRSMSHPEFETVAIYTYWVFVTLLSCIYYFIERDSLYFQDPTIQRQLERFIADRTGVMCYGNLSLIWLFSGRNNIFLFLTGWKFPTFLRFHYHVALIATIQGVVHTGVYIELIIQDQLLRMFRELWVSIGFLSTISMVLMYFLSLENFRRRFYEVFIDTHILLAIASIVGLFYHTRPFEEYDAFLWIPVIIWCMERLFRTLRIIFLSVKFRFSSVERTWTTATYNSASDIITLEITLASNLLAPSPGQYYFLYEPLSIRGYENHPMTIASYYYPSEETLAQERSSAPLSGRREHTGYEDDMAGAQPLLGRSSPRLEEYKSGSTGKRCRLVFWIRPYDGWTRRLRDKCKRDRNGIYHPWIVPEGPYGHELPVACFDATIFIAGGTGVSTWIPYLQEAHGRKLKGDIIAEDDEDMHETTSLATRGQNDHSPMRLVWAAREPNFIQDVVSKQLVGGLERHDFRTDLYCTSWSEDRQQSIMQMIESSRSGSRSIPAHSKSLEEVKVCGGRPDTHSIILETARGVCESGVAPGRSRIGIFACGPPSMMRGVRDAVAAAKQDEEFGCSIELFDEAFTW